MFRDTTDEAHFIALAVLALMAVGLSQGDRDPAKPSARAMVALPVACTLLYFSTGDMLGDVWLFSQRFPVPGLMSLVPILRMPRGWRGHLVTALALALGVSSTANVCAHFIRFEREEVGEMDGAIEVMEPRKHVAGLIYDKGSSIVTDVPFLHFVSYYQAAKGGVVPVLELGSAVLARSISTGALSPTGNSAAIAVGMDPRASVHARALSVLRLRASPRPRLRAPARDLPAAVERRTLGRVPAGDPPLARATCYRWDP